MTKIPKLSIRNLSVKFDMYNSNLSRHEIKAISDISLDVYSGEIVAVAGSSGSGKSLLADAIMQILPDNATMSGEIFYDNKPLDDKLIKKLRGKNIALIPQSVAYLDPLMKVGKQVRGVADDKNKQEEIFKLFKLEPDVQNLYPFQLSGGMARRILISTAAVTDADLIIADEPTPGLDTDMAIKAMKIFTDLAAMGKTVIIITHDIYIAYNTCDRVAIFYGGTVVEIANSIDFKNGVDHLRHPYTKALFNALPQNNFEPIAGLQPYIDTVKTGCIFADRCSIKTARCESEFIEMRDFKNGKVRCINAS